MSTTPCIISLEAVTDTGHPLQVSLLCRFHVGHSLLLLVQQMSSCISPTKATDELTSCKYAKKMYQPLFPIRTCLRKHVKPFYPAVFQILHIVGLPGQYHNTMNTRVKQKMQASTHTRIFAKTKNKNKSMLKEEREKLEENNSKQRWK